MSVALFSFMNFMRKKMAEGLPYSRAHAESSRLEFHFRHHPDELHDALVSEGWE
jgi:hypothetical protein